MKEKFDNLWTKYGLGEVRGNWFFKGLWRATRVGVVGALLYMGDNSVLLMEGFGLSQAWITMFAPMVEKWLRELVPKTKF